MEKPSKQILGVILIFAGFAFTVLGVKILFGPDEYAATAKSLTYMTRISFIIHFKLSGPTLSFPMSLRVWV
jgi:hypothetical protein